MLFHSLLGPGLRNKYLASFWDSSFSEGPLNANHPELPDVQRPNRLTGRGYLTDVVKQGIQFLLNFFGF